MAKKASKDLFVQSVGFQAVTGAQNAGECSTHKVPTSESVASLKMVRIYEWSVMADKSTPLALSEMMVADSLVLRCGLSWRPLGSAETTAGGFQPGDGGYLDHKDVQSVVATAVAKSIIDIKVGNTFTHLPEGCIIAHPAMLYFYIAVLGGNLAVPFGNFVCQIKYTIEDIAAETWQELFQTMAIQNSL